MPQSCGRSWSYSGLVFCSIFLIFRPTCATPPFETQLKMLMTSQTLRMEHFKPGAVVEALPGAVYYNKYIPLLFRLPVPELSLDTLRLNTSLLCISDLARSETPLCPVTYHLDRILTPFADAMNIAKNIQKPSQNWPFFGKFSCDRISPHFFHLSAATDQLHTYSDQLQSRCPLAANSTPITKNITRDPEDAVNLASDKFISFVAGTKSKDSKSGVDAERAIQLQMAGYVGFQATHLLSKYVESLRWNDAFTLCQSYRLSMALISEEWLKEALAPVEATAQSAGYKMALQGLLGPYYKLPLVDCILGVEGKKTTLLIRALVPIVKKDTKYTRFRLTKIPYLISEGSQKKICEIQGFDPKDELLLEERLDGAAPLLSMAPVCGESELCFVAEQPRQLVVDPCVKGLMNGSVDLVRDHCSFDCFPVENEDVLLPIILKVGSNEYSITGSSPAWRPIRVFCDGTLNRTLEPSPSNGLMQVVLPCNCVIVHKSEVYRSTLPCQGALEINHLSSTPVNVYLPNPGPDLPGTSGIPNTDTSNTRGEVATQFSTRSGTPSKPEMTPGTQSSGQFLLIWILLILLSLTNGAMVWILIRNELIDLNGVKLALSRWGWVTQPPSRLREEEEEENRRNREETGRNREETAAGRNNPAFTREEWPQIINRL